MFLSGAVNQQQKTVLGVVLLLLFGGMACCSLTLMLGAYGAYSEAKKETIADLFFDAGVVDDVPPPEDEDGPSSSSSPTRSWRGSPMRATRSSCSTTSATG